MMTNDHEVCSGACLNKPRYAGPGDKDAITCRVCLQNRVSVSLEDMVAGP